MIAHIRPPRQSETPSPLARARRMVAETLLADRRPPPSPWRRWRKRLLFGGAMALLAAGVAVYYWFR
jgi:hypothetical protein